jgi:hypothetical protein
LIDRKDHSVDALFVLTDGRVAEVHLTWRADNHPEWPSTRLFASLDAWRSTLGC